MKQSMNNRDFIPLCSWGLNLPEAHSNIKKSEPQNHVLHQLKKKEKQLRDNQNLHADKLYWQVLSNNSNTFVRLTHLQNREVGHWTKGDSGLPWAESGHTGEAVEDSTLNGSDSQQICASPLHPQSLPLSPSLAGWEKRRKFKMKKAQPFPPSGDYIQCALTYWERGPKR